MASSTTKKPSKGKVARGEKAAQEKVIKWNGLSFTAPGQVPEEAFAKFEFDQVEATNVNQPAYRLVREILGAEQFREARDALTGFDDITELLDAVTNAYGLGQGESEASPAS
jgi:hypothetical protein